MLAAVNDEIPITMTVDYGDGTQTTYDAGSTWWATSFNPEKLDVNASDITITYTLDFSDDTDMWYDLKKSVRGLETDLTIIFDEYNYKVTLIF